MRIRVPQQFIYQFANRLLKEAGVDRHVIDADLEAFVYESGGSGWEDYEDSDGNSFFIIGNDDIE